MVVFLLAFLAFWTNTLSVTPSEWWRGGPSVEEDPIDGIILTQNRDGLKFREVDGRDYTPRKVKTDWTVLWSSLVPVQVHWFYWMAQFSESDEGMVECGLFVKDFYSDYTLLQRMSFDLEDHGSIAFDSVNMLKMDKSNHYQFKCRAKHQEVTIVHAYVIPVKTHHLLKDNKGMHVQYSLSYHNMSLPTPYSIPIAPPHCPELHIDTTYFTPLNFLLQTKDHSVIDGYPFIFPNKEGQTTQKFHTGALVGVICDKHEDDWIPSPFGDLSCTALTNREIPKETTFLVLETSSAHSTKRVALDHFSIYCKVKILGWEHYKKKWKKKKGLYFSGGTVSFFLFLCGCGCCVLWMLMGGAVYWWMREKWQSKRRRVGEEDVVKIGDPNLTESETSEESEGRERLIEMRETKRKSRKKLT